MMNMTPPVVVVGLSDYYITESENREKKKCKKEGFFLGCCEFDNVNFDHHDFD
jgi:hypothetical protein